MATLYETRSSNVDVRVRFEGVNGKRLVLMRELEEVEEEEEKEEKNEGVRHRIFAISERISILFSRTFKGNTGSAIVLIVPLPLVL